MSETPEDASASPMQRVVMCWRAEAPTVADMAGSSEEYFWARGGNFNRPVIVRVNNGVSSTVIRGTRWFVAEVNFEFFCEDSPGCIWRNDLHKWPGIASLEWAGPVPRPAHNEK